MRYWKLLFSLRPPSSSQVRMTSGLRVVMSYLEVSARTHLGR